MLYEVLKFTIAMHLFSII